MDLRKLDALIHETVFKERLFTVEEMQEYAEHVWQEQPNCRVFLMGFEVEDGPGGNLVGPEGAFVFRQTIPRYSSDMAEAWPVYMKVMEGLFSQRKRFYDALEDLAVTRGGVLAAWPDVMTALRHKFPLATCLAALAAYEVDIAEFEDLWRRS